MLILWAGLNNERSETPKHRIAATPIATPHIGIISLKPSSVPPTHTPKSISTQAAVAPHPTTSKGEYEQGLNRWRFSGVRHYQIAISIFDLNKGDHLQGDYVFQARDSNITLLKRMPRYYPKTHSEGYDGRLETMTASTNWSTFLSAYTIEAQFARAEKIINGLEPLYCQIKFNETYGYPSNISCKKNASDIYETEAIVVNAFTALSETGLPMPNSEDTRQPYMVSD